MSILGREGSDDGTTGVCEAENFVRRRAPRSQPWLEAQGATPNLSWSAALLSPERFARQLLTQQYVQLFFASMACRLRIFRERKCQGQCEPMETPGSGAPILPRIDGTVLCNSGYCRTEAVTIGFFAGQATVRDEVIINSSELSSNRSQWW